jgi:hypothetical protein
LYLKDFPGKLAGDIASRNARQEKRSDRRRYPFRESDFGGLAVFLGCSLRRTGQRWGDRQEEDCAITNEATRR